MTADVILALPAKQLGRIRRSVEAIGQELEGLEKWSEGVKAKIGEKEKHECTEQN